MSDNKQTEEQILTDKVNEELSKNGIALCHKSYIINDSEYIPIYLIITGNPSTTTGNDVTIDNVDKVVFDPYEQINPFVIYLEYLSPFLKNLEIQDVDVLAIHDYFSKIEALCRIKCVSKDIKITLTDKIECLMLFQQRNDLYRICKLKNGQIYEFLEVYKYKGRWYCYGDKKIIPDEEFVPEIETETGRYYSFQKKIAQLPINKKYHVFKLL